MSCLYEMVLPIRALSDVSTRLGSVAMAAATGTVLSGRDHTGTRVTLTGPNDGSERLGAAPWSPIVGPFSSHTAEVTGS